MEETTTEVAVPTPNLSERMQYAQALAAADLLPRAYQRKPANVLLAMEYGHALGLDTITAMQSVHVIDGKPTASAQLIGALVRRAGHRLRVTGDDKKAVAEVLRRDDPDFVFRAEWTLERATAAGLANRGPWKQYPAAMLKARAITEVARDACPEALAGVAYTPEELGVDDAHWPTEAQAVPEPVVTVAEVVAPPKAIEAVTDESVGVEMVGTAQLKGIAQLMRRLELDDNQRTAVASKALGKDTTATDMTKAEAIVLVDVLKWLVAQPDKQEAIAEYLK